MACAYSRHYLVRIDTSFVPGKDASQISTRAGAMQTVRRGRPTAPRGDRVSEDKGLERPLQHSGGHTPRPARRCVVLGLASATLGLGSVLRSAALLAQDASEQRPTVGDRLVDADPSRSRTPIKAFDVPVDSKPVFAVPYDATSGVVRDGSKLNGVLLIRLPPESLASAPDSPDAQGVMAYSAVCTHEGCAVTEWVPVEQRLLCVCHFSKFDVLANGSVVEGPAPRALPRLPLRIENGELVVDGSFSSAPGARRS